MADQSIDELMASMGVRKLDRSKTRVKSPKAGSKTPDSARPDVVAPRKSAPLPLSKKERRLKTELDSTRGKLEEVEASSARMKQELRELREAQARAQSECDALKIDQGRLQAELALARGDESATGSGLLSLLKARGIIGEDERRYALSALGTRRELDGLLKHLVVADPDGIKSWLSRRLVLTCAEPGCHEICGLAAVQVAPARCELCGGYGLAGGARDFVSGLLMNGWRRCLILGGPPWAPRVMSSMVEDQRIEVQLVPWVSLATWPQSDSIVDPDIVFLWGEESKLAVDGERLAEVPRSFQLAGPSLGQLLKEAGALLMRID